MATAALRFCKRPDRRGAVSGKRTCAIAGKRVPTCFGRLQPAIHTYPPVGRAYVRRCAADDTRSAALRGPRQPDVPRQKQRALVRCVHDHNVGCGRRRGVLGGLKQVISALHGLPPRGQGGGKIWRSAAGRSAGSAPQIAAFPVAMVDMTANDRLVRERRRKPWPAGVPDSMWHPRARI